MGLGFAAHRMSLIAVGVVTLFVLVAVLSRALHRPRNHRDWSRDQQVLATAEVDGDRATVHNIRNFTYRSETDYVPAYYDRTFDLGKLKRIWYVVEPFTHFRGPAHTFLSFEFEDERYLAISVEIRKQRGQSFDAWKSAFPYYELMYVVADENDVIKLRTNVRKDVVFLYPVRADAAAAQAIFKDYLARLNGLAAKPEFYNLFYDNCTTNIVDAVNRATQAHIHWSYQVLLPSFSDEYALRMGLLDTNLPLDQARARYQINGRAAAFADDPRFSARIREAMPREVARPPGPSGGR